MDTLPSSVVLRKPLLVPSPAAGQDWTIPVAGSGQEGEGQLWLLKSVAATLTQGATQTPQPVLVLADGSGNVIAESVGATAAQGADTTCAYTWAEGLVLSGLQGSGADVHAQAPLPLGEECLLLPGWTIATHTVGRGANSAWSAVVLYVAVIG